MTHLATKKIYKYIIKVETMPDHRLQKQAWNIGQKAPKFNESKRSHLVGCLTLRNGLRDGE